MLDVRKVLAGACAGAVALLLAGTMPAAHATAARPYDYVTVSTDGGVIRINTQMPGQPLWSASADTNTGKVCSAFSYQMPTCVQSPIVPSLTGFADPFGGKPLVTVDSDPSDGSVGVYTQLGNQPLLGVRYSTASGELCTGFSYQVPFCIGIGSSIS